MGTSATPYQDQRIPIQTGSTELDFLVQSARKGDDAETLQRLQRFVIEAVTHPVRRQYELESSINYRYIENDFYTEDELAQFAERGQPPTKRNEIAPVMERIAGQFIQTRQVATFLGRNTPADDAAGALAQDYQRWNDQVNQFEFEEQDMAWDGLIGGVGWLKSYIKTNELGYKYNCVRQINAYTVFKDPYAIRYDPNEDAKYCLEGTWMDLEDVIALVPEKEDALRELKIGPNDMAGLGSQIDRSLENAAFFTTLYQLSFVQQNKRIRCRPFEVWYKRKIRVYYLFSEDGTLALPVPLDSASARAAVKQLGNKIYAQPIYQDRMYCGMFLGSLLLHHDVSEHWTNLFPYVPFYSGLRKNGAPLPLSSRLVPINEAINKRESKALALMTNNKIIAEKGALEDENETQEENAKPDGMVIVRDGAISGNKILFHNNLEMGQAQLALLQEDKDAVRRVSGQGNESMGMPSEVRSGTGIQRKQMMGALIITPVENNLRRTRYLKAKLTHAYMKQYLTAPQSFQITDDPKSVRTVQVTQGAMQALKEFLYDIVITEMKDYTVLREQQAEMLLTVMPQLAKLGPGMVKLGISMTELRDKESLMQMVDQQAAPRPEHPKMSITMAWPDLAPEVQAYIAMTEWQSPEIAKAILQKAQIPEFMLKIEASLAEAQLREGTRATIERGKLDVSALQTATEGKIAIRQLQSQHVLANQAQQADQTDSSEPDEGEIP